jgi:putative glutamine amidotransferase
MIAIAPAHEKETPLYVNWLEKRGLECKVLSRGETLENYSALVLCGGADIGKRPERDNAELEWFKQAYNKIPVLGICRGMQLANVALGGSLVEDIPLNENIEHRAKENKSQYHEVLLITEETITVNSRHHQAVEKVGMGLEVAGTSPDGTIEVLLGNNSLFVQWHPEREEIFDTEAEQICSEWLKNKLNA